MKVFVENNDNGICRMCKKLRWQIAENWMLADYLIFSGGADVWPGLYGEEPLPCTNFDLDRDKRCMAYFNHAKAHQIPMIGICRGGQFLHVAMGGKMWQDVNNHNVKGTHQLRDEDGEEWQVTSEHHQMMLPVVNTGGIVVSAAKLADYKLASNRRHFATDDDHELYWPDSEVIWYPETRSLCYQPHPEYEVKSCFDHFMKQLEGFGLI